MSEDTLEREKILNDKFEQCPNCKSFNTYRSGGIGECESRRCRMEDGLDCFISIDCPIPYNEESCDYNHGEVLSFPDGGGFSEVYYKMQGDVLEDKTEKWVGE